MLPSPFLPLFPSRRELALACFQAWRTRTRVSQLVQQRFEERLRGSLRGCFCHWVALCEHKVGYCWDGRCCGTSRSSYLPNTCKQSYICII